MADLNYFDSSLYNEQIEDELVQLRRLRGHVKGNGLGRFFTASGGDTELIIKHLTNGNGPPVTPGIDDNDLYIDNLTGYLYVYHKSKNEWIEINYLKSLIKINNMQFTDDIWIMSNNVEYEDTTVMAEVDKFLTLLNDFPDGEKIQF